MPVCLISLGSNEGNRQENLEAAVARLAAHPGISLSPAALGAKRRRSADRRGRRDFLNGAVKLETSLPPRELLACLQQIEDELGRRRAERWGPRPIDLDLLLYDEVDSGHAGTDAAASANGVAAVRARTGGRGGRLDDSSDDRLERRPAACASERIGAIRGDYRPDRGRQEPAGRAACQAISGRLILEQPDWSRLDAFYADPAGHAWATELEFLARSRPVVGEKGVRTDFCEGPTQGGVRKIVLTPFSRWVVSDFWFDQSAAFARAWLPAERLEAYLERYERLRETVVRPRLIVLLDATGREVDCPHSAARTPHASGD